MSLVNVTCGAPLPDACCPAICTGDANRAIANTAGTETSAGDPQRRLDLIVLFPLCSLLDASTTHPSGRMPN